MSSNSFQLPPEAAAALARGQLVAAVKIVRQATGLGLKEANDLVQAHAKGRQAGAHAAASPASATPVEFEFPPAAAAAVARGEFVNAIALLREANPRLNLKTAKDAVDDVRRGALPTADQPVKKALSDYPPRVPTVVAGDHGSRGWLTVMLVVVFGIFLLWLLGGT